MSPTMTMLAPPMPIIPAMNPSQPTPKEVCCPNCGHDLPAPTSDPHEALLQAQRQIADLETQIQILNQKANAAVDRWADYEDELSRLRAASNTTSNPSNGRPHTPAPSAPTSSPRSSYLGAGAVSRISQLLSPQRSNSAPAANPNPTRPSTPAQRSSLASVTPSESEVELRDALTAERQMREAAEAKLDATSREVEDLSATLFEQANEMVATERRRAAKLEKTIEVLGRRDKDKDERMRKLEGAVLRIERARSVLGLREVDDGDGFLGEKEREGERERDGDGEEDAVD
ncbi:hypothetical protein F5Y18DRAFT_152672 [Xylariaceae sp. FL1019]|nr:hypothetical protein F5Y18DRAFT_152672 [Xylariaceae sp. FL1019]